MGRTAALAAIGPAPAGSLAYTSWPAEPPVRIDAAAASVARL